MSDAWEEIQAIKSKRNSLRERLEKRKKERQDILGSSITLPDAPPTVLKNLNESGSGSGTSSPIALKNLSDTNEKDELLSDNIKPDPEVEKYLLKALCEVSLTLPTSSREIAISLSKKLAKNVSHEAVCNLLQKFATQLLISVKEGIKDGKTQLEIVSAEHNKLVAMVNELCGDEIKEENKQTDSLDDGDLVLKRKHEDDSETEVAPKLVKIEDEKKRDKKDPKAADILSLLSMPSTKEKENKKVGEEILDLLSKPTAKERSLAERFRSQGGAQVMEFCPHGTKAECVRATGKQVCKKLHFKKIIQKHTDELLGDCSFLNTCFHMDTCKYVHYEVDGPTIQPKESVGKNENVETKVTGRLQESTILYPPQWVQCDLRYLDMNALGKFAVIMADPPWDIHMELPYGTMSDDEMRQLGIPQLQDEGLIFLWVTGRAMELGRECLKLWGYERVDEIIWVKTNQLQRIIRTGRTGHWLNHGKEHCLVGMKGNPDNLNRGLDCDVIVAEVRATSHKPDEIYGMIERLSPGTRKIELFGRPHNVQPNWITLGNQVDGIKLVDPELIASFKKRYPDGNCMGPPSENQAELHSSNIAIIREVYDSENSHETFEMELERALEANCIVIIIEPTRLGDETARWISVGNCLHKTALLSGLSSVLSALIWPETPAAYIPLGALSTLCTGLYTVAWQFDPCVHYQVEKDPRRLARMPVLTLLTAASPVVLVRKEDTKRRYLHCSVTLTTIAFCAWRLYHIFK